MGNIRSSQEYFALDVENFRAQLRDISQWLCHGHTSAILTAGNLLALGNTDIQFRVTGSEQ